MEYFSGPERILDCIYRQQLAMNVHGSPTLALISVVYQPVRGNGVHFDAVN